MDTMLVSQQTTTGEITMKIHNLLTSGCAGLLLSVTAHAGSITCGDAIITDDQPDGQFTQQILDQCGPPTSKDGDNWIYDRSDVGQGVYVLHFDDSGQLDSIQQQLNED
jgi:hypothetical protein